MGRVTHTLMNGGTLQISNLDDFHRRYMEKVISGEKQYIVELKTDPFKFYIDFDLKKEQPLEDEEALRLFRAWEEAVPGPVYVAKAQPRIVDGLWKSGFHVVWPERTVSKAWYTRLRNSILLKTPEVAEYVDTPSSGLRLLWSHKYPVGKPYVPWLSIHKGRVTELDPSPNFKMLGLFSIKAEEDRDGDGTPSSATANSTSALEEFIRKYVKGQGACNVKNVFQKGSDLVIQTDSTFCENLGDHHRSNHVWFLIRGGKICQKCHCKCDVIRKKGKKCKDFSGTQHVLPASILEELEPEPEQDLSSSGAPLNILGLF